MDELREYLKDEFGKIGQRLDAMDVKIDENRAELHDLRGEMHSMRDELRGEMHSIRDELRGEICTVAEGVEKNGRQIEENRSEIRQSHVLIEDLRGELHTVAEGVTNNSERIDRLREESSQERKENRNELLGHIRSSYQSLDRRVSQLEEVSEGPRRMPRL